MAVHRSASLLCSARSAHIMSNLRLNYNMFARVVKLNGLAICLYATHFLARVVANASPVIHFGMVWLFCPLLEFKKISFFG